MVCFSKGMIPGTVQQPSELVTPTPGKGMLAGPNSYQANTQLGLKECG